MESSNLSTYFGIGVIVYMWVMVFWLSTPTKRRQESPSVPPTRRKKKHRKRPVRPTTTPARPKAKPGINPDTLKAMHIQADAERRIGEALWRKAEHTPDPVKRARLEKQAANSDVRFNNILDRIDKLTQ